MTFSLPEVVPWGRSYDEYVSMFALSQSDLAKKILGCGDGPAAFNSVFSSQGGSIVSVDPVYAFNAGEIKKRIDDTYNVVLSQADKNKDEFIWHHISSVKELGSIRMSAMLTFLADFDHGKAEGRYLAGILPHLPFRHNTFNLALCSHLLFLYSEQLSEDFHLAAIKELCRVAGEVRIFPLLELGGQLSRHLQPVISRLAAEGFQLQIEKVPYEFQKGANEMLQLYSLKE